MPPGPFGGYGIEQAFNLDEVTERGPPDQPTVRLHSSDAFAKTKGQAERNVGSDADLAHDHPQPAMIFIDIGGERTQLIPVLSAALVDRGPMK